MTKTTKQNIVACLIILLILVIDQVIKIEVKTNMSLHESREVTSWFYILFIENNGMAFGMSFINKILLTSFRLVAVIAIAYYLFRKIRKGVRWTFLVVIPCRCGRKSVRLHVLRSMLHGIAAWCRVAMRAFRRGIFRLLHRQGGGYVLFPAYRHELSRLGAGGGRRPVHFLLARVQFRRRGGELFGCSGTTLLSERAVGDVSLEEGSPGG